VFRHRPTSASFAASHKGGWIQKSGGSQWNAGGINKKENYPMSTKTKLALAIALVLSTSSAVLAAPRHQAGQAQIPAAEQQWFDRASNPDTNGF
jgi:hypothetical protein